MWRPTLLALLGLSLCAAASRAESEGKLARGCVTGSLASSLAAAEVPATVIAEAVTALRRRIDPERDVRAGDGFGLRYDPDDQPARLLAIVLALDRGRTVALHRLRGRLWFDDGESSEPPRLAPPLVNATVSSPFGKRNDTVYGPIKNIGPLGRATRVVKAHPLLTPTSSFHSGVDYGALAGTPVLAAGDGVVRQAGRDAALGVSVSIEHASGLMTRYGHLADTSPGIAPGVHVTQGQVIGTVGSTGLSSGPHLHYELLVNGGAVNPIGHPATRADRLGKQDVARLRAATEVQPDACAGN